MPGRVVILDISCKQDQYDLHKKGLAMHQGLTLLNDVHIGVKRQAGTTPATQQALRGYISAAFDMAVRAASGTLVIAGDLFDAFEVDPQDLLNTYRTLSSFLASPDNTLVLIAGNHDWSPKDAKLSSFHLLAGVLPRSPGKLVVIDEGLTRIAGGVFAIPHMPNQDLFNLEIDAALGMSAQITDLILHCNYDNKFAERSDHSLNLSREKAIAFSDAGVRLIFAHEHQAKKDLGGNVYVLGNQWPSSIADCLGNSQKSLHKLGASASSIENVTTWEAEGQFAEVDWKVLDLQVDRTESFIRVVGNADAAEAEAVVNAVAKFRLKSNAYVVSNAVKIDGIAAIEGLMDISAEAIKAFDVLHALLEELSEEEQVVVKSLLS